MGVAHLGLSLGPPSHLLGWGFSALLCLKPTFEVPHHVVPPCPLPLLCRLCVILTQVPCPAAVSSAKAGINHSIDLSRCLLPALLATLAQGSRCPECCMGAPGSVPSQPKSSMSSSGGIGSGSQARQAPDFPHLSCHPGCGSLWQPLMADSSGRRQLKSPSCCHTVLLNRISPCPYFA